eukprot:gene17598-19351_t
MASIPIPTDNVMQVEEGLQPTTEREQQKPVQTTTTKAKSPEPRRRKYSLASVKKMLEKKPEDTTRAGGGEGKEERKAQKRDAHQENNTKPPKKGIFHLRHKQKLIAENGDDGDDHEQPTGVYLIPPAPRPHGYSDLLVEDVSKPRLSTIIHVSEHALLSDVQRPRSPRIARNLRIQPDPPVFVNGLLTVPQTAKHSLDTDSNNNNENNSPMISQNSITSTEIKILAQTELNSVLKGEFFQTKKVAAWSKTIAEGVMLKVRKLTNGQKKVIATVFIGEQFPGTVEVLVSCHDNAETDNFQTISTQINDIYAWVSVWGLKL